MKLWIGLLFVTTSTFALADTQPPFQIGEQKVDENFRQSYDVLGNHRHSGNDGTSLPYDWIPSSNATYDLGNSTYHWRNAYIDNVVGFVSGGGGAGGNSTRTVILAGGGDVYLATNSFAPVPRAVYANRRATFTTVGMTAYCIYPSTVAYTWFRIAKTSSTDVGTPWTYVSPTLEVTTNAKYSNYYTTGIVLNDKEAFALQITSVPQLGILPSEYGVVIEGWSQNTYP